MQPKTPGTQPPPTHLCRALPTARYYLSVTVGVHPEERRGYVSLGSDPGRRRRVGAGRPVGRYRERIRSQLRVRPPVSACARVWPRAGLPLGLGPSSLPKQKQCGRPRRLGPVAVGARCALGNLRASPGRRKATRPALRRRLALSVWVWITNWWLSCPPALQSGGRAGGGRLHFFHFIHGSTQ